MKKYVLSIAILIVLLLASAIFLPYLFKDKIIESVKTEVNKNLKANLEFAPNIGINIFKSFPNLNLLFKDLSLVSKDTIFQNDTFFAANKLEVSFDLMTFYKEGKYIFKNININESKLHLESVSDSIYNWDLVKSSSTDTSEEGELLNFELEEVKITQGSFDYLDTKSSVDVKIVGIDHLSNGNFNTEKFTLTSKTEAEEVLVISDGIAYLNNWKLDQSGDIEVDLENDKYTFPKNSLSINGLEALLDGSIQLQDEDILFDMGAKSKSPDLNKFLTLIPAVYTSDFGAMQTKGAGKLNATFKGKYSKNTFPAYDLKLLVDNGWFKYPDLSLPAEDINLNLHIYSLDGNTDKTVIDIPQLHFKLANDQFDAKLNAQDLFGNPLIDAVAKGDLNLSNVSKMVPLPNTKLTGELLSDLSIKGRINDITASAIEKFTANGVLKATNLVYRTSEMAEPLEVSAANLIVKNQRVSIPNFRGKLGSNDVDFSGKFDNFFGYVLSDETLTGSATLTSDKFNANDFTADAPEGKPAKMTLLEVPGNVELDLTTSIKNLKYDDLELNDFAGKLGIKNQVLNLKDISTGLLGGRVNIKGLYEYDINMPLAKFDIAYSSIKIADLMSKFRVIKAFAPLAEQVNAMTTAQLNFSSELNNDMSPKLSNINLEGSLNLENIVVEKLEVLKGIDKKLGTNHFNIKKLRDFLVQFKINDGKLLVSPFDMFIDSSKLTLNGISKLDGSISYNGFLSVPSSYVKNETNIINSLTAGTQFSNLQLNPKDFLDIAVNINGTFKKPEIKLNLKEIKSSLKQKLKNTVVNEVDKKKEEAKAKATNELNKIKEETQRKADEAKENLKKELEQKKKEAEERLRQEAEERKKKLKEEAAKKLKGLFK